MITHIRKEVLSKDKIKMLFSNETAVEEKIDVKFMSREADDYDVFYEYMGLRHEIQYTRLLCYEIILDVYDMSSKKFLKPPEKHKVFKILGFLLCSNTIRGEP